MVPDRFSSARADGDHGIEQSHGGGEATTADDLLVTFMVCPWPIIGLEADGRNRPLRVKAEAEYQSEQRQDRIAMGDGNSFLSSFLTHEEVRFTSCLLFNLSFCSRSERRKFPRARRSAQLGELQPNDSYGEPGANVGPCRFRPRK